MNARARNVSALKQEVKVVAEEGHMHRDTLSTPRARGLTRLCRPARPEVWVYSEAVNAARHDVV